jgi:hypothetical protein
MIAARLVAIAGASFHELISSATAIKHTPANTARSARRLRGRISAASCIHRRYALPAQSLRTTQQLTTLRFSLVRLKPKLLRLSTTFRSTCLFYLREPPTASLTIKHEYSGDRIGRQAQDLPARDRLLHCPGL